jgi:hypothetical protein
MKSFVNQIFQIEEKAKKFILSKIPKGKSIQLLSDEEAEEQVDSFYELPVCFAVGKYGDYKEYAITKVEHTNDDGLLFHTFGKSDEYGVKRTFNTSEISDGILATIADLIIDNEMEKNKKMTQAIKKAFNHVKKKYPTVSIVIFDKNGQWLYMDENFNSFTFDETIDVSLLEDASDSTPFLPYIYQE